ncbi:MAG: HAMP domain-containing histidine kinase [Clostridiaceae bacterium]|nr:HAMP domain-containing histidine kinase [Clostridiaceae bacterium]
MRALNSSIGRRIFLSNFIVIFLTVVLFEVILSEGAQQFYYGGVSRILTDKALSNADFYNMYLKYENLENKAYTIMENYSDQEEAELQIVDITGNIIASTTSYRHTEKIDTSPLAGLKEGEFNSWQGRISSTDEELLAVSTPLVQGNSIVGYLRLVTSLEGVKAIVNDLRLKALVVGGLILALSLVISLVLSKTIVRPIKHLTEVSRKIACGDFDTLAIKEYDDEIGELSDTLNFMTKEIKKSNNLKNEFISSISHEIRTPLTSIRGWAETIDNNSLDIKETKQGISMILKEAKRLTLLVEELLDFSRFESGRINMNFEKVDLNLLVRDVLKQYSIRFKEKNLEQLTSLDNEITYVIGDSDRLRQVFLNIIDNAWKFSGDNGFIKVSTERTPKGARVYIEDNGTGITSDELPYVTEKFYKGKSKQSGSGLGLSISKEIIELHKGKLILDSTQGKGTRVIIELGNVE